MWITNHLNDIFKFACITALVLYSFIKYSKWRAPALLGGVIFAVYIASVVIMIAGGIYYLVRIIMG